MNVYALHGFLGQPSDWDFLDDVHAIELSHISEPSSLCNMWQWAAQFNGHIKTPNNILIGYSLGGRLALHALLNNSKQWCGAIFISAHPGLASQQEKDIRLKQDAHWADRFLTEPWGPLMHSWNAQPIFSGHSLHRHERNFSRERLGDILRYWSLGLQDMLQSELSRLDLPILWIAGEEDERFKTIAQSMTLRHTNSEVWIAPKSGHRIPWQQPFELKKKINQFQLRIS